MWSWSYSNEGLQNIADQIRVLSLEDLVTIYCEWEANANASDDDKFKSFEYKRAQRRAARMSYDTLADYVSDKATNQAISDNGAFDVWVCPYGCHTVKPDPV